MLIPSSSNVTHDRLASLSRRVNANSQRKYDTPTLDAKLIKKGEC